MRNFLFQFVMVSLMFVSGSVYAGEARDMANDPVLEKRMVGLAENLRCLVCQNESLASSHAELAEDLRREVRELMQKGMTDQEIKDFLVARYGDFVLYEPPLKSFTLLLWLGPFALLTGGLGMLVVKLHKRQKTLAETTLSPEARQRADDLLNDTREKQP
jgi:cytochrome c-type biogenesis protein CcmH